MAALLLLPLLLLPAAASKECDIVQYGAKSDGTTDSTRAIQHALDACAGGTVRVPAPSAGGDHLSYRAGSLQLRSHQRLVVEPGAMLEGLTDARAYPIGAPFPSFCGTNEGTQADCRGSCALPFLGAEGVTDVEITGGGTIDGGSPTGHFRGPRLIQFRNSSALRITNVTVQHSAFWTIHFYGCNDVAVTDSRIVAGITVGETDGVDLDSTSNAYIARNHIEVGDDGVALKSGMGACGRAFATPTTNVTIEHNFFNFSGGVAIGSEMSGGVRDITVRHNVLRGDSHRQPHLWTWGPRVLTIKSDRGKSASKVPHFHMLDPQLSWECMHGIAKTNFKSLQWSACLRLTSVVTWVLHRAWRCSGKRPCPEHNLHRLRSDRSHHHGRGRLTYAQCSCDAHRTKRYCTAGERHCRGAWCVIQSIILLTCIYAKNDSEPDFALAQDSSRGCRNRHCR
jgi:hypothetical protein